MNRKLIEIALEEGLNESKFKTLEIKMHPESHFRQYAWFDEFNFLHNLDYSREKVIENSAPPNATHYAHTYNGIWDDAPMRSLAYFSKVLN